MQLPLPWLPLVWAAWGLGGSRVSRTGWECSLGFWIHPMKTFQQILVCAFLAALTALVAGDNPPLICRTGHWS
jgi:hypothetical protein